MSYGCTNKDGPGAGGTPYWLLVDADGHLQVDVLSITSQAAVLVDDAAFTVATDNVMMIGGFADETAPDSVNEGDGGAIRMSLDRMMLVQASGRAAEDAAVAGNPLLAGGRYDVAARTLDDGDVGALAVNALGQLFTEEGRAPTLQSDEALNDSDKTFTVPANTIWDIRWIWVEFTSTATVGARQLEIEIQDGAADVIAKLVPLQSQAASLAYTYLFSPSAPASEALRDGTQTHILSPDWLLPAGYVLRVWDNKAIDAAADDMIIQMMVEARTV